MLTTARFITITKRIHLDYVLVFWGIGFQTGSVSKLEVSHAGSFFSQLPFALVVNITMINIV